ncbi:MAG: chemotaxis family two-component system response regulator Rcp1 [Polaribacter sp.]
MKGNFFGMSDVSFYTDLEIYPIYKYARYKTMQVKTRPVNVLLIEDNPGDVRLMQEAFNECRSTIDLTVVMDGLEAIHFLKKENKYEDAKSPDLILLDLNLPKKSGKEILAEIKSDPELKRIPVIILTTSNSEYDIIKSYDLHVNGFINKPVDFDRFFEIIQHIERFWLQTAVLPNMLS